MIRNKKLLQHPLTHIGAWLFVGVFATFSMDLWGVILHIIWNKPWPNYSLLGRYFLTAWQQGQIIVPEISKMPQIAHENLVGWLTHLAVGLADTFIYMVLIFKVLHTKPHLLISMIIGWALIFMPFLIEQPMLGMGIAGRLTADPTITRLTTFSYHTVFGICLFLGSWIFHEVFVLMSHIKD